ncbi:MAG TPA: hypothetical protein VE868_09830 [Balneolaceae bacterium]|nr:hypothetical protein [Balneolaceae bacterium]
MQKPICHPDPPDDGEGSQAIIPFVIVEKGLSETTFEIPRLPTAVGILGMTKSLVLQSPLIN